MLTNEEEETMVETMESESSSSSSVPCSSQQVASNVNWGIPKGGGLRGGGLNSLNNGTSGWGAPPSNANAAATGWGAPPAPGQPAPQNPNNPNSPPNNNHGGSGATQWGASAASPNRNSTSQSTNGQPNLSGSQMNINNPSVGAGGTGGSASSSSGSSSSWAQAAGKSLIQTSSASSGGGPNSSAQLNTANSTPNPPLHPPGAGGHQQQNSQTSQPSSATSSANNPQQQQQQQAPSTATSAPSVTSKQMEQLNSMREALFSHDGWGGQNVNQDSSWDIPGSPEPSHKEIVGLTPGPNGPPSKMEVNNGTWLWEVILRKGGDISAPPQAPPQKAPWKPSPSSNIGGTWGEEDEGGDTSSSVWNSNAAPPPPSNNPPPSSAPSNWGNNGGAVGVPGGRVEPPPPQNSMWGSAPAMKKEHPSAGGSDWNSGGPGRMPPPQPHPMGPPPMESAPPSSRWGEDPRGVSNSGWPPSKPSGPGPQGPPHHPSAGGWGPMKPDQGGKPMGGGWDDVSPPTQRRPVPDIPNYDDGTALWGGGGGGGGGGQRGLPPRGLPPANKPQGMDDSGWGPAPPRNGGWPPQEPLQQDQFNGRGGGGWGEEKQNSWGGGGGDPGWGKPKPQQQSSGGWGDEGVVDTSNWGPPYKPPPPPTQSTPSRYCNGNGSPLSYNNSNTSSQQGSQGVGGGGRDYWTSSPNRGHPPFQSLTHSSNNGPYKEEEEMEARRNFYLRLSEIVDSLPELNNSGAMGGMGRGGQSGGGFPPSGGRGQGQAGGRVGPRGPDGGPMDPGFFPMMQHRNQQQQQQPQQLRGSGPGGNGGAPHPTHNKSVVHLVQQIQSAVQLGYLPNQFLQHPLPPQSLVLLQSLLQHIKSFHMLTQAQQQLGNSGSPTAQLQISVQLTKTKQQIQNLNNQIAAQLAQQVKQQHQGGSHHGGVPDFFKGPPGGPGGMEHLGGSGPFGSSDLPSFLNNSKGGGGGDGNPQQQTSRLSQWTKLPSMEKDGEGDFSRAPGGPQQSGQQKPNSGLILGPNENTWSTNVNSRNDGWPVNEGGSGGGDADPMKGGSEGEAWQTDLVPEFEPGKPWKGTQILKTVDDDPTLTPGSVVRSPLSLATAAAAEIFAKSTNSTVSSLGSDSLPLSLSSSSTWSYTPTSASGNISSMAKLNSTRDLWEYGNSGGANGSRPPPGLPKKQTSAPGNGNSICWLLLRNLTPQIDGSTLKTLCMQHGPLQKFHLNLGHGIALVRYNGREEATKAQNALNNCVLGNTTILAEIAAESDIQGLLHSQIANNSGYSGGGPPSGGNGGGREENPWGLRDASPLWSNNPWGGSLVDAPDRATPSSLNSLLPDGLLGGESA